MRGLDTALADLCARLWEWVTGAQDLLGSLRGLDYVLVGTGARPPNARKLTAGANVTLTDTGPDKTLIISATGGGGSSDNNTPDVLNLSAGFNSDVPVANDTWYTILQNIVDYGYILGGLLPATPLSAAFSPRRFLVNSSSFPIRLAILDGGSAFPLDTAVPDMDYYTLSPGEGVWVQWVPGSSSWVLMDVVTRLKAARGILTADASLSPYELAIVDASGGSVVLTAPAHGGEEGREFLVRRLDDSANTLTVQKYLFETIEYDRVSGLSAASVTIPARGQGHWRYVEPAGVWKLVGSSLLSSAGEAGSTPLYVHPATPHADDEEFEQTGVPAGWILYDITGAALITPSGTPDPYSNPGAGAARFAAHTGWRKSFGAFQGHSAAGQQYFLVKPITPATNMFIWTRMGVNVFPGASTCVLGLALAQDSAGHPDFNNCVFVASRPDNAEIKFQMIIAGASTTKTIATGGRAPTSLGYYGIQKIGSDCYGYVFNDDGTVASLDIITHAQTYAWVGYFILSEVSGGALAPIHRFDFLRRVDSAQGLPT